MWVFLIVALAPLSIAQSYSVTDLGTLGGPQTQAFGMNDNGDVVGVSSTSTGARHAFLWTKAAGMQDLGTNGFLESWALGVNNSHEVVGYLVNSGATHGFRWTQSGGMKDLGSLGSNATIAQSVNGSGVIVGVSANTSFCPARLHVDEIIGNDESRNAGRAHQLGDWN